MLLIFEEELEVLENLSLERSLEIMLNMKMILMMKNLENLILMRSLEIMLNLILISTMKNLENLS